MSDTKKPGKARRSRSESRQQKNHEGEAMPEEAAASETHVESHLASAREYYAYEAAIAQIEADLRDRCHQAAKEFNEAIQARQTAANQEIERAYRAYSSAFHRHQIDPEEVPADAVNQAYRDYLKAHQQAREDAQQAWDEARERYTKAIEEAHAEAARRRTESFYGFIDAMKRAWADIDPPAMNSQKLAAIAQSLLAAATRAQVS